VTRIDSYLDGDLKRSDLTGVERADADQTEAVIDAVRGALHARPLPDHTPAVMAQVALTRPRHTARWKLVVIDAANALWTARKISFHVRPAWVVLTAFLCASAATHRAWPQPGATLDTAVPNPPGPTLLVQFRLEIPATNVRLAGSFTNWEPKFELREAAPGVWTALLPVPLGVHDYAFLVDGRLWYPDPYAPQVSDGFGGRNSRLALVLADGPQT
jgi:hypothetical protein